MKSLYQGVTFIELLCVMACLAVLVGLTAVSMRDTTIKIQRSLLMQRVKNAIAFARMQAVSMQVPMVYCGSSDLKHCDGNWNHGQLIHPANSDKVIQTYLGLDKIRLTFHANFGRSQKIEFMTTGFTNGQNGRFDFCIPAKFAVKPCESLILHFSGQIVG